MVRSDLPRGIQAANLIHAAGESSPGNLPSGTFAIALVLPDEASLWRLADLLRREKIDHRAIIEADGPFAGQLLAVGIAPQRKEKLRKHLASLPLLK